jgi:hypothetical protein
MVLGCWLHTRGLVQKLAIRKLVVRLSMQAILRNFILWIMLLNCGLGLMVLLMLVCHEVPLRVRERQEIFRVALHLGINSLLTLALVWV